MKYALFIALILSAFYIGTTQLLLSEVNDLKNIYANADVIAQNIANSEN